MNLALLCLAAIILLVVGHYVVKFSSDDPRIWERDIRRFEREDRQKPAIKDVIVFTGSSSIRYWESLQADMAPLAVINRGFGGSQIHQVTEFAERIVLPYKPTAVVFYAGENDIAGMLFSRRKTASEVRAAFERFCARIHAESPGLPIYFISIKPPKARLRYWPEMQAANRLVAEYCATDPRLHFIDLVPAMLDESGRARSELFRWDGIHLNEKGYAIWTARIKPVLTKAPGPAC